MNIEKIENRIKEINLFLDNNRDYSKFNYLALFKERSELNFKLNKQNIYTSLRGDDKYYKPFNVDILQNTLKKMVLIGINQVK